MVISTPNGPVSHTQKTQVDQPKKRVDLSLSVHSHDSLVDPVWAFLNRRPFCNSGTSGPRRTRIQKTDACVQRALARERRLVSRSEAAKKTVKSTKLTHGSAQLLLKVRQGHARSPLPQQAPAALPGHLQQPDARLPSRRRLFCVSPSPRRPRSLTFATANKPRVPSLRQRRQVVRIAVLGKPTHASGPSSSTG